MATSSSPRSRRTPYRGNGSARNNCHGKSGIIILFAIVIVVAGLLFAMWRSEDMISSSNPGTELVFGTIIMVIASSAIIAATFSQSGINQDTGETVTKIVEELHELLRANDINPHAGREGIFKLEENSESLELRLQNKAPNNIERGNLLQYLIYKYLIAKQGYRDEGHFKKYKFYDPTFGEAAWTIVKPKMTTTTQIKLLEVELSSYQATGRADFYTCGSEGPSNLIDFKWTAEDYSSPSPGYALQLLLYQWMAGERFKEEKGARMYLIRFVDSTREMQLIPFDPPERIQYSRGRADVKSYEDIVRLFMEEYYPELLEDNVEET